MNTPIVTISMAVYNADKYIKEAIESVLNQTYTNFELLIINDGSTDKSLEIIDSFSDNRIRLLHNDGNKGLLYTRNKGLNEAKGKYIAILDADDVSSKFRIEKQVDFLENNSEIGICGSWGVTINSKSEVFGHKIMPETNSDLIPIEMLFRNQFIHSSVMYKTEIAKKCMGYEGVNGCEDYNLFSKISLQYKMANLPEFLIQYREHQGGISKMKSDDIGVGEWQILKQLHFKLNINDQLLKTPFAIVKNNYTKLSSQDITNYFIAILNQNKENKVFNEKLFSQIVFKYWYYIILEIKNKSTIFHFYKFSKKFNFKLKTKQKKKLLKIYFNPF